MYNPEDIAIKIKKYLKKLSNTINNESSLTLMKVKIINKKKVDDILCCIEATFPDDYRDFVKKNGVKRLKSAQIYQQLLASIRRKFWLDTNSYSVLFNDVADNINALAATIESDIKKVYIAESGML